MQRYCAAVDYMYLRQGGYVARRLSVCLSVCLQQPYVKTTDWIFT